jgi:ssDNA-binding Zn-finger/Zn-ribbon topoisomerase 1
MQSVATKSRSQTVSNGVVYRITCQNPGCGYTFDLKITAENAGLLGGTIACPRCKRHGGMLKREGRLGDKLFSAKLVFRPAGTTSSASDEGDLFSEAAGY